MWEGGSGLARLHHPGATLGEQLSREVSREVSQFAGYFACLQRPYLPPVDSQRHQLACKGIETTDPDAEQPPVNADGSKTEWCGQACLAFGLVCKAYGYNIARAV